MPIKAIRPNGFKLPEKQILMAELDRLGKEVTGETKQYPPWRPWKNPPKSGPRAGGRRTGDLGRKWESGVKPSGQYIILKIENPVSYAKWVQGKKQTKVMKARGWRTLQKNFAAAAPKYKKRLQAWARLRRA